MASSTSRRASRRCALQDEAARAGRALPSIVSGTGVPRTRRIQAAIERGVLTPRPMFSSIEPDGVRWDDGTFQQADAIIWSTGIPARAAPPRSAQAAREGGRRRRCAGRVMEGSAGLLRRVRTAGLHYRRQPRRPYDRPPGHRDAEPPPGLALKTQRGAGCAGSADSDGQGTANHLARLVDCQPALRTGQSQSLDAERADHAGW